MKAKNEASEGRQSGRAHHRRHRRVHGIHLGANAARVRYRVMEVAQGVSGFRVHLKESGAANGKVNRKRRYAVQILTGDPVLAGRFGIGKVITLRVRQAQG